MTDNKRQSLGEKTQTLLNISSAAIADVPAQLTDALSILAGGLGSQLLEILTARNGFYAFETALHVLPADCRSAMDIARWNHPDLWKRMYVALPQEYVFFAEDIFANQFGIYREHIFRFNPETGKVRPMATDFDQWSKIILDDYEYETGYPLANKWQEVHGPLLPGMRLFPKTPFVVGGEYSINNLFALDATKGIRYLAEFYRQIADLPDGSQVRLRVNDSDAPT